jgi:hypothetical protein
MPRTQNFFTLLHFSARQSYLPPAAAIDALARSSPEDE